MTVDSLFMIEIGIDQLWILIILFLDQINERLLTLCQSDDSKTCLISIELKDVQYLDVDYMIGNRILTVDQANFKGLNQYLKQIRNDGLKSVLVVVI